jgi:hypothetical protein
MSLLKEEEKDLKYISEASEEDIDTLLTIFETTGSHKVRDTAAIALSRYRDNRIPEAFIRAIEKPSTKNHRGTIVHLCGKFDCSPYFLFFVNLVVKEAGEPCLHAIDLIGDMKGARSREDIEKAIEIVRDWKNPPGILMNI